MFKRLALAVVAFFGVMIFTTVVVGDFLGTLLGLGAAVATFMFVKSGPAAVGAPVQSHELGAPTFAWKGMAVYRDQGFLVYQGRKVALSDVTRISYETSGFRGCLGGTGYLIHVHLNNIATPRLTLRAGNITAGGNQETEQNYERLAIALGCNGR